MDKSKPHGTEMKKEIDILISKLNALEAAASGNKDLQSLINSVKISLENQKHFVDEFEHLKKAIDLLTMQIFKTNPSETK